MTTYREAIYMCLDLLKGMSDDFSYTEEHVAYLLDKFRALLLKQRYGNDPKKHVPYSNYQTITFSRETTDISERTCPYVTFKTKIPYMLQIGITRIYSKTPRYYNIEYEYVSRERMPFVGTNKYLKNIVYFTIDDNNTLMVKNNKDAYWTQAGNITIYSGPNNLNLVGVFENPRDIIGEDYLDANIPIEESLITTLIEMVVKELAGSMYIPEDSANNASDDKANLASFIKSSIKADVANQINKQ